MIREPCVAHQIPAGDAARRERRLDLRLTCRNNILGKERVRTFKRGTKTATRETEKEAKIFMVTFYKRLQKTKERTRSSLEVGISIYSVVPKFTKEMLINTQIEGRLLEKNSFAKTTKHKCS